MLTVPVSPLEEWTALRLGQEHLSRAAIDRWQLERLREVVAWARERSPFYRHLYRDVPEGALHTVAGLRSLPFLEHDAVRERGLELVCVSLGDIARVVTVPTSGSTGSPKRLWFTEEDLELTRDHFRHGMRALVAPGDRVLVLMPGQTPGSVGALLQEGLIRDGITVESYGFVDDCDRVAAKVEEFGPSCLVGVPGQVVRLARSDAGARVAAQGGFKSVLLSGDHVTPAMRAAIEQPWDCRVYEHYGSTELGLGGAVQCRAFAGLHIREADLLFEVVEPSTGEPVPDGREGELVATTLTRRGMPLIRYRTGDLVRLAAGGCACGSVLRCLEGVLGRKESLVSLPDGTRLTVAALDEALYAHPSVLGFTAGLDRTSAGDRLVVRVDTRADAAEDLIADLARRVRSLVAAGGGALEVAVETSQGGGSQPLSAKQSIAGPRTTA
jgi:phenylacetate-CoA ligase